MEKVKSGRKLSEAIFLNSITFERNILFPYFILQNLSSLLTCKQKKKDWWQKVPLVVLKWRRAWLLERTENTPSNTEKCSRIARNAVKFYKDCVGKFIWMGDLIVRSNFENCNFLGSLVTSQSPEKSCKIPSKICNYGVKWQEMLPNAIHFVWVSLPGRRFS